MNQENTFRDIFVGREDEISIFRKLLENHSGRAWLLNIYSNGEGGVGKTKLLEHFQNILMEEYPHVLFNRELVDFYFTSNQHEFGALRNLISQIGADAFTTFEKSLTQYENRLRHLSVPLLPDEQHELQRAVYDNFVECYHVLAGRRPIVLFFDTTEEAGEAGDYLWEEVFPRLSNTIVLIAGRQKLSFGETTNLEYIRLDKFNLKEAIQYFHKCGFEAEDLPKKTIESIWKRTDGRPILTALVAEYLKDHAVEELLKLPVSEFTPMLISRVYEIGKFENQAILYMAHAWRRFNSKILAYLSGNTDEICQNTIQRLRLLPFIKYRTPQKGGTESCLLHDEIRDIIGNQIWPLTDRDGIVRRELSGKMVDYYNKIMPFIQHSSEMESLICEKLFYQLDYDLEAGFTYSRKLFEEKSQAHDIAFCEAINTELSRYEKKLSTPYHLWFTFQRGWVAFLREQDKKAIELWDSVVKSNSATDQLKTKTLIYLVEAHADGGDFRQAEECGEQAKALFMKLKKAASGAGEKKKIEEEAGLLYNNLGYMCRRQEHWEKAIEYYEDALKVEGPLWQEARIRNNLGYAHHLLGHAEQAFSFCETALRIRQKLNIPYELGLSYNTLGILYVDALRIPEAEASFQRAIEAFDRARSARGRALVYTALGRLYRQWGWYEEHIVKQPFDQEREKYRKALDYLNKAITIYEDEKDEAGLAEARSELGCTYRHRHDWNRAINSFKGALELARSRSIHRREVDILQDISLTYLMRGEMDKAEDFAVQASKIAQEGNFHYILSKVKWVLGDIAYAKGQFEKAFQEYAHACINITRLDPTTMGHHSAKKNLHYEDLVKHVEEQILLLPTRVQVESACDILVKRWREEKELEEKYRGFIERINAIKSSYDLLKESKKGPANVQ